MPKLSTNPISENDLEEFLASESDFAFEMSVLSLLRRLEFGCSHAGTYQDPVTQKIRQYDLRAVKREGNFGLALAVECKNLRPHFPLLINAVPRTRNEAFHEIIVYRPDALLTKRDVRFIDPPRSIYKPGEMVGKRTDQVGRAEHNNELFSDDAVTFDKISQAINSSKDVVADASSESAPPFIRVVVPVLVIPHDSLWQVDYDHDGNITERPRRVNEATYFIDHVWSTPMGMEDVRYRISHLHIVTFSHLEWAVNTWMGPIGFFSTGM